MDDLAETFEWFAGWADDTSPLYASFSRRIADDEPILDIASDARDDQIPPNVLFAAVQYLLLSGADHRLADYYPSLGGGSNRSDDSHPDDAYEAFRAFCLNRESAVRELVATRRTQTNSVRRCAVLYPAFSWVARQSDGPLAIVELGASAGLNLNWDRYRYSYGDRDPIGDRGSPATARSVVRGDGEPPLPVDPPSVSSRVGVDLHPLDVTDPEDQTWLRALVWPEHEDRHRVLQYATDVADSHPPTLVRGDAVGTLPGLVGSLPRDHTVVVYDTLLRYQLDDETDRRLQKTIAALGADRDLHWLSGHGAADDYDHAIELAHATVVDGRLESTTLAVYQQHGEWIEWRSR